MAQSGAVQSVQGSTSFRGLVSRGPDWRVVGASVRGPLLTLAVAIVLDILAREGVAVVYPFPLLILTVMYAASSGGLRSGLVSAVLTVLYAVHFFSEPRSSLHYTRSGAASLILVGIAAPVVAFVVAHLRSAASVARGVAFTRAEVEAMDRRLSFFAQANLALASTLDFPTVLRDLARMMVPSICDWCAIHVATDQGRLEYISGAHRDPARDLVVRALCEYGSRGLPFGQIDRTPELLEVTDELLRTRSEDQEHLKLYRALSPTSLIRVPLVARGGVAGVLTLATIRESGRRFGLADLEFAEELAGRVGLTVDHGRIHREAREADRRYRLLFDANPQPMWVFDVETLGFLAVNDAAVRHYGYSREEFLSMTLMDIRPPDDTPGLLPGERGSPRGEVALTQHQRKDGSIIEMEIVSHELEMDGRRARLVLATDISERTRVRAALHDSEEQLRHAQRMDAVGRLASGVAHDFNNLLTTIRGFSDLLLHDLPPGDQRRSDAEQIRKAADRGAHLSRQLLSFGRKQVTQARPVNLNVVVGGMQDLIQRLVGADVRLDVSLEPDLGSVRMDAGQLEQVLVNLVLNAREAMPGGGTLTIKTSEREVGGTGRSRHLPPGSYAVLSVGDTGSGVDLEGVGQVFEPFYSGQHAQRGGLGLSIVYGIVRHSGGAVRVSSEPEQGTVVKVYLPRVEDESADAWQLPASLHGNETILVAEDEVGVRDLIRKVLTEQGHTVLAARNGREALELAQRYEGPIHLVLSDVVMPEMGGSEFVRALVELRPSIKVLYVSGYTNDEVLHRGIAQSATFVAKPFAPDDLIRKVRELLDGETA
jgi:two-component system cell cycle sensor histidine kinase/response regulator CckA